MYVFGLLIGCLYSHVVPPRRIPAQKDVDDMRQITEEFLADNGLGELTYMLVRQGAFIKTKAKNKKKFFF